MNGIIALEDGTILKGKGFGAEGERTGEVVFNTSLVGYEESLTDPSYKGQILTSTYPLIGNYGVRKENFESDKIQVEGFVIRELNNFYYHRNAVKTIEKFLEEYGIPGISEVDTRLLTKKIRVNGVMNSAMVVSKDKIDPEYVLNLVKKAGDYSEIDLLEKVGVKEPKLIGSGGDRTIALLDLGVKLSIVRDITKRKINVLLVPSSTKVDEFKELVKEHKLKGLFLSNGPGNPENATDAIKLVREMQSEMPISGICFGNQILGLALGGKTYKLKFGHRGTNQPVKDLENGRVYITSQNHGFAVDEKSLDSTDLDVSMINLNDHSVEGLKHKKLNIQSVQFHPEANPGPWDTEELFDRFTKNMK